MVKKNLRKLKKQKNFYSDYQATQSEIKSDFRKLKIKLDDQNPGSPKEPNPTKEINPNKKNETKTNKKKEIAVEMLTQLQSLQVGKSIEKSNQNKGKKTKEHPKKGNCSFSHIRSQFSENEFQSYLSNMVYPSLPLFAYCQNLSNFYYHQ